ncbi:nicotinate (nicotinamide) nucleotide adenylyltransferase [Leptospira wolffii]|uniref:Probable nicotinate-nucleotide adenylyltransferase n=1 Tax=Leptospira wolffii TaxID=409998 RepID=A0ABV5BR54_9LEPT
MRSPSLTGIYGGSFDPPHLGHLEVVKTFWKNFPDAEELVIVPNRSSPWKEAKETSPENILKLVNIQFRAFPKTRTWDWEILREEKSYTEDTLEQFRKENPKASIALLVGEDQYSNFHKWRNWRSILDKISLLLVFRRISERIPENKELAGYMNTIRFLENPIVEAASSEIRRLLPRCIQENRKPIALDDSVWNAIRTGGSYR